MALTGSSFVVGFRDKMKPMSLAVGTRLGAYEILGMIGAGDIWSTKYVQNRLEELTRLVPVQ